LKPLLFASNRKQPPIHTTACLLREKPEAFFEPFVGDPTIQSISVEKSEEISASEQCYRE
jgi:hypothetical protein